MKKIFTKIFVLIILSALVSFNAITVNATASGEVGSCSWQLVGTELTISGNGSMGFYPEWPWGNNITSVTINEGVTTVGMAAFAECHSLTNVTLPNSLKNIESHAFYNCSSLREITIPDSVVTIDNGAFSECAQLIEVTISKNVTYLGLGVFNDCDSLTNINVNQENPNYSSVDGVLFDRNKTVLIKYPQNKWSTSYSIPSTVTRIGHHAFAYAWYLENISIPDTVTRIGVNAFFGTPYQNNISNYVDGVLYLGKHLIVVKENVTSCSIKEGTKVITDGAFSANGSLKSIIIPNSVITIGGNAFAWCSSLENITIPKSVKTIGESAFYDCSALKNVWYVGSNTDKSHLFIDTDNINLHNATWHYDACHNTSAHTWDAGIVTKQASCTTTGILSKKCTTCQTTISESIPTIEHSMGKWSQTKQPTCTAKGIKERKCSKCTYTETKELAVLKHNFKNSTISQKPTCTESGVETGTCTRCKQTTSNVIKALGHRFGSWEDDTNATCTKGGTQKRSCTICNKEVTRATKALGHDFEKATIVKEATISSNGIKEGKCKTCGEITSEVIPCTTKDETTGTIFETNEGVFLTGTEIKVQQITKNSATYESVKDILKEISDKFVAYDISAVLNEMVIQPNGEVNVTFNIPEGFGTDVAIYYIDNGGTVQELASVISEDGKTISTKLTHFSTYAICSLDADHNKTNPINNVNKSPEINIPWNAIIIVSAVMALILVSVVIIITFKKKKK